MKSKPALILDKNQNEIRTLWIQHLETRSQADTDPKITGRAAVYGEFQLLIDMWGDHFYERIQKGALTETLAGDHDIFALKNHNWNEILGRTGTNLTLSDQENGLYFELVPNHSTLGRDILEDVRSGLIQGCSIGFRIVDQEWEERKGEWFRTITGLELREITLTPIPAYTSTSAEVRSLTLDQAKVDSTQIDLEQEERSFILAEAERIQRILQK
jgi:uncharacterized protein